MLALALAAGAVAAVNAQTHASEADSSVPGLAPPTTSLKVPEFTRPPAAPGFQAPGVTDIRRAAASAPREADQGSHEGAAVPKARRTVPAVPPPKEEAFSLFGLAAMPTPAPRNEPLRKPEFYAAERSGGGNSTAGSARAVSGQTLEIPLDTAMPAVRVVVNWMRSNRDAVLVASLAVLALTWARTRRPGRQQAGTGASLRNSASDPSRRRRRHRHERSSRYGALPGNSSHSSSRSRSDGPWAPPDAGRSSGRHR